MATATATPGLIVARDLEIAAWLDRVPGATVDQLRRRFALGRTQAYRRLQVLADYGIVRRRRLTTTQPPLYTIASRSLRVASVAHAVQVAELVVALELAGREVISDLELRRERALQASLGGRLTDGQLRTVLTCARVPDTAELLADGALVAYEIELSSKGRTRRGRVLAGYAASGYDRVVWICPESQLAALIAREISDRGLAAFMEVRRGIEA